MLDNLLNAMRNSITDMGEPWGIPLNRGNRFAVCTYFPITHPVTLIQNAWQNRFEFEFLIKKITYVNS